MSEHSNMGKTWEVRICHVHVCYYYVWTWYAKPQGGKSAILANIHMKMNVLIGFMCATIFMTMHL